MKGVRMFSDCTQIEVPLQLKIHKKIDSEKVREGPVKSTRSKESEIVSEMCIYKHLKFYINKIPKYFCIMDQRVK